MTVHYRKHANTPTHSACNNAGVITTEHITMVTCKQCMKTRRYKQNKRELIASLESREVEQI